jgi:oligopeptide transport system substrate-binding protein
VYGGRVMDLLFNGLVSYDASGKTVNEVAKSITTTDSQHYDIKLNPDWKFSNGDPVTAKSFVDAWNYGALSTNAQLNSYFFTPIQGYDAVSAVAADGKTPAPTAKTMSGLKVVSDTEFTVDLVDPESDFPLSLGYTAFYPMPASAFTDIKAYGQNPIGNGPYVLKKGGWQHNVQIELVPNSAYHGKQKAMNAGITFKEYSTPEAAYTDLLANNLDVLDGFPANALKTFKTDLPNHYLNKPVAANATLTVPSYLKEFSGQAGLMRRQALSMAINRKQITDKIYFGTRSPAKEFTSPALSGYDASIPGNEVLTFDATKAKQLWDSANAITPWDNSKPLTIAYNSDGAGNKQYIDALANQIKNVLGIDAQGQAYATFKELRNAVGTKALTGLSRAGWQGDYPSLQDFLGPLYATGAGSNDGDYSSAAFDAKLKEAGSAKTPEAGNKIYNEAQQILLKDLPVIPLWYNDQQIGWSSNVSGVQMSWSGVPLYYNITSKK